jgi:hypothetical protein
MRVVELSLHLWQLGIDLDRLRVITAILPAFVAIAQQLVEFLHETIEDAVSIVAANGSDDIGTADLDLAGRGVMMFLAAFLILIQPHVDADDPFVVAQKDGKFLADNVLHGGGQLHVHALHDDLIRTVVGIVCHGRDRHPSTVLVTEPAAVSEQGQAGFTERLA